MAANRHTFTQSELDQYFTRISLPPRKRIYNVSSLPDSQKLTYLHVLQKHHLVKIPWENLIQHYSWHKVVHLSPLHLFREIVLKPGRGGYCMQVNYFHHLILYSLGFDVYMSGSRIWRSNLGKYGGWTHVVNLVTIAGERYLLDGGFGAQGPTTPLKLDDGVAKPQIAPAEMRVVLDNIPNNLSRDQKLWIYQYRYSDAKPWTPAYCFTDMEFTPQDIEGMNFEPMLNKRTFFTYEVAVNRFTTSRERYDADAEVWPGSPEEELEGEIDGAVVVYKDVLTWRRRGEKVVEEKFGTDGERVVALRKFFGIELGEDEVEGIRGTAAEVGVDAH